MTAEGWRELVLDAVRRNDHGDSSQLGLLGRLLAEQDEAKQVLRDLGYGCIGMPWADRRGRNFHRSSFVRFLTDEHPFSTRSARLFVFPLMRRPLTPEMSHNRIGDQQDGCTVG